MKFALIFLFINFNVLAYPFRIDVLKNGEHSTGIGFFVANNGMALTSYHVVKNVDNIYANIEGSSIKTTLLGYDEVMDVAALKVDFTNNNFFPIQTHDVHINDVVKLDGVSMDFSGTVIEKGKNEFYTDINISQGFSGSPILYDGKVCGIVVSYEKKTNHAVATQSKRFLRNYSHILQGKIFKKKDVGFYVMNLTRDALTMLGINLKNKSQGVLITRTTNNTFQVWDIVTHINGYPVNNTDTLQNILTQMYEGEYAEFKIIRNGEVIKVTV